MWLSSYLISTLLFYILSSHVVIIVFDPELEKGLWEGGAILIRSYGFYITLFRLLFFSDLLVHAFKIKGPFFQFTLHFYLSFRLGVVDPLMIADGKCNLSIMN